MGVNQRDNNGREGGDGEGEAKTMSEVDGGHPLTVATNRKSRRV